MNPAILIRRIWMLAFFFTLFSPASTTAQDKLRIGLSSVSATSGSIWVAEEKGLFKKHGLDAEVIIIGGGASRVVSSLIAGEIQFSVGGGDSVIRSALRGADTVLAASPLKTGLQRLMVRPDIKTPAELKSKKVGITRFGSASHWVLQLFLRKWGMRSEDVQMVQLGSSPAMFASLEMGAIDGAVFTIPTFFLAEDRGYRILADPVDLDIYYLQNSVDTTKSFLRQKHDLSVRFVKAICEGLAYFRKNKKESLAVMQKKLRIQSAQEKDIKYLEASYTLLATKFYNQVPYAMPKRWRPLWNSSRRRSPRRGEPTQSSSWTRVSFARSRPAASLNRFTRTNIDDRLKIYNKALTLRILPRPAERAFGINAQRLLRKSLSSDTRGVTELFGVPSVTARDFPTRIRISKAGI